MDYRERKRLEHEIDRGVPNVGIYKVDPEGLERENRSPIFKGAVSGFGLACPAALAYIGFDIFDPSPRHVSPADEAVMALIMAGGPVIGALFGWVVSKYVPTRGKPKATTSVVKRDH